ncbi:hypothetical protein ASPWEDRAFT_166908 [Aspergillus wentii DTO 134E9]|uniref:Alpha-1,2-mannosyltransferase n=1 Tax=Aspergillus wentii DTO 134E9 TaxID=1073089 RepID=A0A1L9S115_ASPWE|nr:uncharacterized protein ASPWEDRAFT_166908 [Aspergillus wentii DTO 134E9]KAI9931145.1 hypothetical protein MW887_010802 [Aspergillus wentii]OJJ40852.1 hypothetical protein ASPWEDRAFT_166908 [Aspergillus wentii DTO 134E9]
MWNIRTTPFSRNGVVKQLALILLFTTLLLWHQDKLSSPSARLRLPDRQDQLRDRLSLLREHEPKCPGPALSSAAGLQRFDEEFVASNEPVRIDHVENSEEILQPMQTAHDGFVQAIQSLKIDLPYVARSEGIVSSAGGTYLPTFLVTLRLLRRTGSTLPVELFVRDWEEYEPYVCEVVLPPLNAKCVVLSTLLSGPNGRGLGSIEHFQIKSFAILFSSFEKAIWLDADCVPLYDPSILLHSKPFTSTGLVTWPDFWASTVSPVYYNISRQPETPPNLRQATEAGVILVSKKSHSYTLLLATYYNYYGPSHYYGLLDQGAPGEGDKDTFIQAAAAMGEKFHTVSEPVMDVGRWGIRVGDMRGAAMLQADPMQDYKLTSKGKWRVKDPSVAKPVRGFFLHAYNPEFNPGEDLLGERSHNDDGSPSRVWTASEDALKRFGYDIERGFWEETKTVACSLEHAFDTWKSRTGLCENVEKHWKAVFENPSAETLKFTDD